MNAILLLLRLHILPCYDFPCSLFQRSLNFILFLHMIVKVNIQAKEMDKSLSIKQFSQIALVTLLACCQFLGRSHDIGNENISFSLSSL